MKIAERIQHLRKAKGISQEELADKIGVSRQAVSKWESEQTTPDIEKIILMSEFFEVTTDYLLKGTEPAPAEVSLIKEKQDASVFTIIGTAFNIIGLIVMEVIWYEEQRLWAFAIGFSMMIAGCVIYAIGMLLSNPDTRKKAKRKFWMINVWVWMFLPLYLFYNLVLLGFRMSGLKLLLVFSCFHPARIALFVLMYIVIGVIADCIIVRILK